MSAASSPQANPVTPSLCWDSIWPPSQMDRQCRHPGWPDSLCRAPHQPWPALPLTQAHGLPWHRPLGTHPSVCHLLYLLYFFISCVSLTAISVLPRRIIHCITAASNSAQHCVCALLRDSHLPWNPLLCCRRLFCDVWPWPQPDARRCRMPQAALSPRKGGLMEWYPILLQCWLLFLFRSQFRIALHGFVLGYLVGCVSLYYHRCFVCLSSTCLLSVKNLFFCSILLSGIATWSALVSFSLNFWNTFLLPVP